MATIDYTKIDQNEVTNELIALLQQTTSFKNANFSGTALYDLVNVISYNASLFGFYLNNIANEPFLDTARQYKNINRIANSLLYFPIGKGSAQVGVASKISKEYVLNNTEGFIEIPTYSQFISSRLTDDGKTFGFTNEKPLVVQVTQFGMAFIKESSISYVGEIFTGGLLDAEKITINGQTRNPIQIVESATSVAVVENAITSVAHETLPSFNVNTIYSLVTRKIDGEYSLAIMPKTSSTLSNEILRFKVNSDRSVSVTQNFSQNKMYLGRLGFRNLVATKFEAVPLRGKPDKVGRIKFIVPRYAPAFEVLFNGEVFSFSSDEEDVIIQSDDIQDGTFEIGQNLNVVLDLTDVTKQYYGAELRLKKDSSVIPSDIIIGVVKSQEVSDGAIEVNENTTLSGEVKQGKVEFLSGEISKRVTFDEAYEFGLSSATIPFNSSKNYSILIYANDNVKTFYSEKKTSGFVINVEPERGFTGEVYWKVIEYESSETQEKIVDIGDLAVAFDTTKGYSVLLQPGLNILTWASDINNDGFKIVSDTSFVGSVDYLIVPESDMSKSPDPSQVGTVFVSRGEVEMEVTFDKPRVSTDYTVFLQPEDNVNVWYEAKSTEGFVVRIEADTDFAGRVDWQIVESELSGTIDFGGSDAFQGNINIQYVDLPETSFMGFSQQGLPKITSIEENGNIKSGVNGLEFDYDTDITVNPGLSFEIQNEDISYNNIRVFVKTGNTWAQWTEAKNFKEGVKEDSPVFHVRVNKDKKITLKFGNDDLRGKSPLGSRVSIIGLETIGSGGNIGENVLEPDIVGSLNFETSNIVTQSVEESLIDLLKIKKDAFFEGNSSSVLLDYLGNEVDNTQISVVQVGVGMFGTEPEGVESIRHNAKLAHTSQERLVTKEDYKSLVAGQFSNFIVDLEVFNFKEADAAGLIPSGENPFNYFNTLFFMMIPSFGTSFTLAQRETINAFLSDRIRKHATVDSVVLEPTFVPIDVVISYASQIDVSPLEVRNNISSGVLNYFKRENRKLGETITLYSVREGIDQTGISQFNMQLVKDEGRQFTPSDYDVDIKPSEFEDEFQDVQQKKLDDAIQKEVRNLIGKGLIELKQPLFDVEQPSGDREWLFTGDVVLGRFEFPVLGDLVIERMI
jgi:hypothetical protein